MPNYDKSSFELAKEIVNIMLLQSPSHEGLRGLGPLSSAISGLVLLLELDLRHMPPAQVAKNHMTQGHFQSTQYFGPIAAARRVGDVNWWGSKLPQDFKLRYLETHAELQSADGILVAYATSSIQKDNWIIQSAQGFEDTMYGEFWTNPITIKCFSVATAS